jgi:hypothetical protein
LHALTNRAAFTVLHNLAAFLHHGLGLDLATLLEAKRATKLSNIFTNIASAWTTLASFVGATNTQALEEPTLGLFIATFQDTANSSNALAFTLCISRRLRTLWVHVTPGRRARARRRLLTGTLTTSNRTCGHRIFVAGRHGVTWFGRTFVRTRVGCARGHGTVRAAGSFAQAHRTLSNTANRSTATASHRAGHRALHRTAHGFGSAGWHTDAGHTFAADSRQVFATG